MNSMKRQKDRTLKDELPRSVGVSYSIRHCVRLFATPWTVTRQASLSLGFFGQEAWSGLPFPSPVDHILSDLSAMTRPSWVALHRMA